MKTVLVTGGIGSGKSAVCAYLASRGVPVYDSDSRTKALYTSDPALLPALESALGISLRDASGKFDRHALAAVIFADTDARTTLEKIVYPAVLRDFLSWREACSHAPWCGYGTVPFVVMESAVAAHKAPFDAVFDKIVAVAAPLETMPFLTTAAQLPPSLPSPINFSSISGNNPIPAFISAFTPSFPRKFLRFSGGPSMPEAIFPEGPALFRGTFHAGGCFPGRFCVFQGDLPCQRPFSRKVLRFSGGPSMPAPVFPEGPALFRGTFHARSHFPGRSCDFPGDLPRQRPFSWKVLPFSGGPSMLGAIFPEGLALFRGTFHARGHFPGRSLSKCS